MDRYCWMCYGGYVKVDSESEEDWEQLDFGIFLDVVGEIVFVIFLEMIQRKLMRFDFVYILKFKLLNKCFMMLVVLIFFKYFMIIVKENVLLVMVFISMQDCCVQVFLFFNGVDKSIQIFFCEYVE